MKLINMIKKNMKKIGLILALIPSLGFAVLQSQPESFGGVASNTVSALGPLASLIFAGIIIIGIGFIMAGLIKFKAHRDNPQAVTISTVITLFVMGTLLVLIGLYYRKNNINIFSDGLQQNQSVNLSTSNTPNQTDSPQQDHAPPVFADN